jgi:hypothetical protein
MVMEELDILEKTRDETIENMGCTFKGSSENV